MKIKNLYFFTGLLVILFACGVQKQTMSMEEWENGSTSQNQELFTKDEVDDILTQVANSEHKNLPFQATPDKDWELIHTDIKLEIDFDQKILIGTAKIKLKPYFYPQKELSLNAKGMDIISVELAGQKTKDGLPMPETLKWSYEDSLKLNIQLPYIMTAQEVLELEISYQSNPERRLNNRIDLSSTAVSDDKGVYFVNADGSKVGTPKQVWTQGEPESNSRWFPTLDKPNQKHTQKITLIYPESMFSISNGELTSSTVIKGNQNKVNLKKDVWEMNQKHAVYLSMFAIGNWTAVSDSVAIFYPESKQTKKIAVRYFVEPGYAPFARQKFGNTPEMIQFFSKITGVPYPWNKYDQIVCREFVSGAMENTTAVIHNERLQDPTIDNEDYIAHELFHHWFGDLVTCESWSHLSMNESFASYAEYLWREYKYGKDNAEEWLYDNITYPNSLDSMNDPNELETSPLINHHYKHPNDQFDDIRYNKGAQILHELRNLIGNEAFNLSMNCYLSKYAYQNGNAYDWKKCVEGITGKNMDHFFNSWYFQGGEFLMAYQIINDTLQKTDSLYLLPQIAESSRAKHELKNYGKTKFQRFSVHLLGRNAQTWDTTITFFPHQKSTKIGLPFRDSQLFIRYTNPQNIFFTFDVSLDAESTHELKYLDRSKYVILRALYVLQQEKFSYMEKVNLINDLGTEMIELGTFNATYYPIALSMIKEALNIDKTKKPIHEQPLLTKVTHEFCWSVLANSEVEITDEHIAKYLKPYQELLLEQLKTVNLTKHQVYYLNFLQNMESLGDQIQKKSQDPEVQMVVNRFKKANHLSALEAVFYYKLNQSHSNGSADDIKLIQSILEIINDSTINHPLICKFLMKLWDDELAEIIHTDIKKALLPSIAEKNWPNDLKLNWLQKAYLSEDKNTSLVLDQWTQIISKQVHWIEATQFGLKEDWLRLKKSELALNSQEQLRLGILEQLFSMKP